MVYISCVCVLTRYYSRVILKRLLVTLGVIFEKRLPSLLRVTLWITRRVILLCGSKVRRQCTGMLSARCQPLACSGAAAQPLDGPRALNLRGEKVEELR